jgi:hypothetical protein
MKLFHRSILTRTLMAGATSLAFMMLGTPEVRAETVIGAGGAGGATCDGAFDPDSTCTGGNGGDGESVVAGTNPAMAIGGNGGEGGLGAVRGTDGTGGAGGSAFAEVMGSGSGDVVLSALATGGEGGAATFAGELNGSGGPGGGAGANSNAASSGAGNASSSANATGGAGGRAFVFGGAGGSASASSTARSIGSGSASSSANATGGVSFGAPLFPNKGGDASASSTATSSGSGAALSSAAATGGAGADTTGGFAGSGGDAMATVNASAAGGGTAVATATATGGAGGAGSVPGTTGAANATSTAEAARGAFAQAQSTALGSSGQAQSTATTSFGGVSVQSSALAPTDLSTATTIANAQGGSGQAFVNPGQTAYAFSTAQPDKAYAASLIGGASDVASALLGPRDAVFGTAILGANYASDGGGESETYSASSTFDFGYGGDLQLGLIDGQLTGFSSGAGFQSMEFTIEADGVEILDTTFRSLAVAESFFHDDVIDLGSDFGPNIDLTFGYTLVADGSGGFGFDLAVGGLGAAPEPSTWAMMLAGFAGLGFMGRRRRAAWAG